jgi:hypothetical protein
MLRLTYATLILVCALTLGALSVARHSQMGGRAHASETQGIKSEDKRAAIYKGVSFSYDASLASEVKAETVPGVRMREEGDEKEPAPEHVAFTLVGTYKRQPESYISPEIHVYPVAGYSRAVAASKGMSKAVRETIQRLKTLLRDQPAAFRGEVPTLPVPDGHQAFRAHLQYLRFRNGRGIMFLTQGQQDEMPVNNQSISYEFQGLTDDGQFYVTAEFPVAAPFLADDRDAATYDGFKDPGCFNCKARAIFVRRYRAYAEGVGRRLDQLQPENFQPSLRLYDELINSLEIKK